MARVFNYNESLWSATFTKMQMWQQDHIRPIAQSSPAPIKRITDADESFSALITWRIIKAFAQIGSRSVSREKIWEKKSWGKRNSESERGCQSTQKMKRKSTDETGASNLSLDGHGEHQRAVKKRESVIYPPYIYIYIFRLSVNYLTCWIVFWNTLVEIISNQHSRSCCYNHHSLSRLLLLQFTRRNYSSYIRTGEK